MILEKILYNLKYDNEDIAYTIGKCSYTYKQLYQYVCNLYQYIIKNNINKKSIIVYGHKEVYMKAAFLACGYAGVTYVPVDCSIPFDRICEIIDQIDPFCIIGDFKYKDYKYLNKESINSLLCDIGTCDIDNVNLQPDDIMYIIFTSGTTGKPKGVQVTYENVDSCITWLLDQLDISKGVILNQANFSFDLSVADVYLSLITKSEHYILETESIYDFRNIFKYLYKSNVNLAVMTPSFVELLLLEKSFNEQYFPNLRQILLCGETLKKNIVNELYKRFSNISIINSYGPTECTFAVTCAKINNTLLQEDILTVGMPKKDVKIYIVDKNMNALNSGEKGEILITGKSVSKGYINQENNKFIIFNGKRGYLTGDYGYIKNGMLYCTGRIDDQIKYKGYRIELLDIENNISDLKYIENVKVIPKYNESKEVIKIFAFIKMKDNYNIEIKKIKYDVRKKIPEYMVPTIKIIKKFPINNNGKIDKKKLEAML